LNKLPKSQQAKAKQMIHNIYLAASRQEGESGWKNLSWLILPPGSKISTLSPNSEYFFKIFPERSPFFYFTVQILGTNYIVAIM